MSLRAALCLGLASALPFATVCQAESKLCVPDDSIDPILIVNGIDTDTPRLQADYGRGLEARNVPCVAKVLGKVFDCEQGDSGEGVIRYFKFVSLLDEPRWLVQVFRIGPRKPPQLGVQHELLASGMRSYQCRVSNLVDH